MRGKEGQELSFRSPPEGCCVTAGGCGLGAACGGELNLAPRFYAAAWRPLFCKLLAQRMQRRSRGAFLLN